MKVSIITISYNSQQTIEQTIQSVISQDYPNIEYIIIDGASTDDTLNIIKRYQNKIQTFVSEKDQGIYFAMNKGLELATGDLIGILNSDDLYVDEKVISDVVKLMQAKQSQSLYADLEYVDRNDLSKVKRYWKSGEYRINSFMKGWMPPHPTYFVLKSVYEKYGFFNTQLRSAADYEMMLRLLHKEKISVSYLPRVIIKMRVGGKSNQSISNRIKANKEDRLAWKLNGLKPGRFTLIRKPLSKLKQFFKK